MTTFEPPRRRVPPRRSPRERIGRVVLLVVGLGLAFLLGVAFARTLDDRPTSGGAETIVRTLTPIPQSGPGTTTVTVTVTATRP